MSEPSFHELGLSEPVSQALAKREIHAPFEIQALVLRDAIAGLDILAKSPTGSGKTLAFALPIVDRLSARRPAAVGAGAGADPRAGRPGDRRVREHRRRPAA